MEYEECPICYELLKEKDFSITSCNHKFHTSCLLKNGTLCPLCRHELIIEIKDEDECTLEKLEFDFNKKKYTCIEDKERDVNFINELKYYQHNNDMDNYIKTISEYDKITPLGFNLTVYLLKIKMVRNDEYILIV